MLFRNTALSTGLSLSLVLALSLGCSPADGPSGAGGSQATGAGGSSGSTTGGSGGSSGNPTGGTGGSAAGGTSGSGGSSGSSGTGGTVEPPKGIGVEVLDQCTDAAAVGPTLIRRLSRFEYHNAVRDLFGVSVNQGDLPSDELLGVFTANVKSPMTVDNFTRYDTIGNTVAEQVSANFMNASGCAVTDAACTQAYLTKIARRAFHGQELTALEQDQDRLFGLYDSIAVTDATLAVTTSIRWILNSPRFLYTIEFGTPEGAVSRLSAGELAGRLATFLWRSIPDDTLLAAADAGSLDTPEGIRAQATAMLADAKAQPVLAQFAKEWLGIGQSPGATNIDQAIDAEPGLVFTDLVQGTGVYPDLMTTLTSRGPAELAAFYGGTDQGNGSLLLPAERAGLLTRAAFARAHVKGDRPSPTQRGMQIREAMLCDPVELPATNVNMQLPPDTGQTDNELFDLHANAPECAGCHTLMDPIGYAFGNYAIDGSYDPSLTTTTAGYIATETAQVDFADTQGLLTLLATDAGPQKCFAIQSARFALGRNETVADACGLVDVWTAFSTGNLSLKTLLIEVATSRLMQVRNTVRPGEACQ
jgi:hypothetical protein